MYSAAKVYRYLRFKKRFISGRQLVRLFGIPPNRLEALYRQPGIGGMGPCYERGLKDRSAQFWQHYAKDNAFDGDFLCFFRSKGRYLCIKDRPLRIGKSKPKRTAPKQGLDD